MHKWSSNYKVSMLIRNFIYLQRHGPTLAFCLLCHCMPTQSRWCKIDVSWCKSDTNSVDEYHISACFWYLHSGQDCLKGQQGRSKALGRLPNKVLNQHIKLSTKLKVYEAIVLTSLLYGWETRTLYHKHMKQLENLYM